MTVWCHLLGLHRPKSNNSESKDNQSSVLLPSSVRNYFQIIQLPSEFLAIKVTYRLLADIKKCPQFGIRSAGAVVLLLVQWEYN